MVAPAVTSVSPTGGPPAGGTTVTITGTNMGSATAVKFGATNAASIVSNTATQIVAVSPAGASGQVDVKVTNAGGTSATVAGDKFTYTTPPTAPTVVLTANQTAATITVGITNSGSGTATHHNDIYVNDGTGWMRRAKNLAASTPWTYYTPKPGRDYDTFIKVIAYAADGTPSAAIPT